MTVASGFLDCPQDLTAAEYLDRLAQGWTPQTGLGVTARAAVDQATVQAEAALTDEIAGQAVMVRHAAVLPGDHDTSGLPPLPEGFCVLGLLPGRQLVVAKAGQKRLVTVHGVLEKDPQDGTSLLLICTNGVRLNVFGESVADVRAWF